MSKRLPTLIVYLVALVSAAACAQTTQSPLSPSGEQRETTTSDCALLGVSNAPCSIYRDDAHELGRATELWQQSLAPSEPQQLTEFLILVAGSVRRIVPVYGSDQATG